MSKTKKPDKNVKETHEVFEVELNSSRIPIERKRRLVDTMTKDLNQEELRKRTRSPKDKPLDLSKYLNNYQVADEENEEQQAALLQMQ